MPKQNVDPNNAFGPDKTPLEIKVENCNQGRTRRKPKSSKGHPPKPTGDANNVPETSSAPPVQGDGLPDNNNAVDPGVPKAQVMEQLVWEGGVNLMNYLFARAVLPHEVVPKSWEDIAKLPPAERKEWIAACKQELEDLKALRFKG